MIKQIITICLILISITCIFWWGFGVGFNNAVTQIDILSWQTNYDYLCSEYHDSKKYGEESCNVFFINKTGNYCDGILVCENSLKVNNG